MRCDANRTYVISLVVDARTKADLNRAFWTAWGSMRVVDGLRVNAVVGRLSVVDELLAVTLLPEGREVCGVTASS